MRHLVLSDDGHNVAHNAYHRILATSYFPESSRDREQGLFIASMEQAEFDRVGKENYQPSEITRTIASLLEKRTAHFYLVGLIGIAIIWLQREGQKPSLNRASIIASCVANEVNKVIWTPALNPNQKLKRTAVTSDKATAARIFRKYQSVAHIWAANLVSGDYLEPAHAWDRSPEVIATLIQTYASMQKAFEATTDTSRWNMWDVTRHFPSSLEDWPALTPDAELLSWVQLGHSKAIDQGLIQL